MDVGAWQLWPVAHKRRQELYQKCGYARLRRLGFTKVLFPYISLSHSADDKILDLFQRGESQIRVNMDLIFSTGKEILIDSTLERPSLYCCYPAYLVGLLITPELDDIPVGLPLTL